MTASPRSFRASFTAMLGICMAFMLMALNTSMVGTAMPRIVADLRGYDLYPWAASAFLFGNAVLIPVTGRLGDLYGRKPFMLCAVGLFALASVACALAQTMGQLVLGRGLQGLAAGMLLGVAPASVPDLFPGRAERVRWQVMLSSSYGVALALGPTVGGWLTEHAGWRLVFYMNLPVAMAALASIWLFLPRIVQAGEGQRRLDWAGALLLAGAVAALMGATETGHGGVWALAWGSVAVAAGYAFFQRQYRTAAPIVPPPVLDNRDARKLMGLGVLTGMTMFMLVFYAPLLLQGSFGQSPKEAGLLMTPMLVCITFGSIVNGRLMTRMRRAERLIAWGQAGTLVSCLLLAQVSAETSRGWMALVFALSGFSLGFQLPNLNLQLMEVCGRTHLGVGGALAQTTRMVGSMLGVGVAGVLVNAAYGWRIDAAVLAQGVGDPALIRLLSSPQVLLREQDQASLLRLAQALGHEPQALLRAARQALASGAHMAFVLAGALAGLSIVLSLRLPRFVVDRRAGQS